MAAEKIYHTEAGEQKGKDGVIKPTNSKEETLGWYAGVVVLRALRRGHSWH